MIQAELNVRATAPDGEPYKHIILQLTNGQNIAMELTDDEAERAIAELHAAVLDKRASYVVLHPLDESANGAEYHYPGMIVGIQRITQSHKDSLDAQMKDAEEKREAQEAIMRARGAGLGGAVGRR